MGATMMPVLSALGSTFGSGVLSLLRSLLLFYSRASSRASRTPASGTLMHDTTNSRVNQMSYADDTTVDTMTCSRA